MPRTSESAVREIITTGKDDLGNPIPLQGFIEAAAVLVNRVVSCAATRGFPLDKDEQRLIETWLAAHFYAHRDQLYQSKNTQSAGATFQGKTGMHLESTQYGQTAMDLDYSGCLTALNNRATKGGLVSLNWLGKSPSEQIPYWERD